MTSVVRETPQAGEPLSGVDPLARAFFWVALTFGGAALVLCAHLTSVRPAGAVGMLTALAFGFIGTLGFAVTLAQRGRLAAGVALVLIAGYLNATAFGLLATAGILTSAFGFYGLLVLAAGILLGTRAVWISGALCASTLVALHAAESVGWIVDPAAGLRAAPSLRLGVQLALLGASAVLASLFSKALQASLGMAHEQEGRFRRLMAIGADWYWEQDRDYRFTRVTSPASGAARRGTDSYIGKTRWEVPHSGLTEAEWEAHRADLAARRPFRDFVMGRRNAEGQRRYISISGEPTFGSDGSFAGYWGVGRDVTEQVEQRHARMESEARFRSLLGIAVDWYWEQDTEFRFTKLAGAMEQATGSQAQDVLGRRRWEIEGLTATPEVWAAHRADLDARRPFRNLVLRWHQADAADRFMCVSGEPNLGPDGEFHGYWGVVRDVTDEVTAQRALEASERRYRVLFDRSPLPKLIHRDGMVLMGNEAAARLFSLAGPSALIGRNLLDFYPDDEHTQVRGRIAQIEAMPEGGELPAVEVRVRDEHGAIRMVQATGVRVMLNAGLATLTLYFDITERKHAEEQLRRSEAMLARLFDASPDALLVSEVETGALVRVNDRFVEMTGFSRDELIGRSSLDLGIWVDPSQRVKMVEALERDGVVHAMPVSRRTKDGRLLSVRYSAARMQLDGRHYMIAALRDVTEQEREHLQQQAILANASVGIAFTRDRVFHLANPRFEEMFGWAPGTLAGQSGAVVWPSPQAYAEAGRTLGPRLADGQLVAEDLMMQRRGGEAFWCRIRARAIDPGNPVDGGTIWIAEDVSDERAAAAELAAAKDAAESANRAKSMFLANTSHEIRTPLNGLLGLTRLALRPHVDAHVQRRYLEQIQDSGETLHAIISDILDLSKIEAGKLAIERVGFDLRELLDSLAGSYRELALQKGLAFALRVDRELPRHVSGDPTRIRQMLSNFLSNAVKFTQRGGIELQAAAADGCLRLSVIDSGIGIEAAARAGLFTPFAQGDASTTRRYGGTGLGLSISRQLAELMHGRVGVDSTAGVGSTFWVELPLLPVEQASATENDRHGAVAAGALHGVRVLLAEDNDVNRLIAQTLLAEWGIEVVTAVNGQEAVAAVDAAHAGGAGFDLVLMDLHMPVMSGADATAALRRRYSADRLPIVALTAAALGPEREQCLAVGMNDFVAKPFEERQLFETVKRWSRSGQRVPAAVG